MLDKFGGRKVNCKCLVIDNSLFSLNEDKVIHSIPKLRIRSDGSCTNLNRAELSILYHDRSINHKIKSALISP